VLASRSATTAPANPAPTMSVSMVMVLQFTVHSSQFTVVSSQLSVEKLGFSGKLEENTRRG